MLSLIYSVHNFVPLFLVKLSWITQNMRNVWQLPTAQHN